MAYCPNCGASVPPDAAFCPNCGHQLGAQGASADPGGGAWVPPPVAPVDPYPLQFQVDYPDRPLSRVSTFFRIFAAIPILIVAALMQPDVFEQLPRGWRVRRSRDRHPVPAGAGDAGVPSQVPGLVV